MTKPEKNTIVKLWIKEFIEGLQEIADNGLLLIDKGDCFAECKIEVHKKIQKVEGSASDKEVYLFIAVEK